jgi:signal transduction histidine kinase
MGLQATATRVGDEVAERRLEGAVSEIDRVIRDLRNYIFGLRPGLLADRQLQEALVGLGEEFEEKSGVTTVVDVDNSVAAELASRAGDVLQLAREALSNVGRHAKAATVRVSLQRYEGDALLEIDDDGKGFDVSATRTEGQGLRNLRERAAGIGGQVDIQSTAGEGTTVRVRLPV